ncbi:MAG: hypothetical protein HC871_02425, partial [Rhizobiales bacterium]|nr:hypothetical protein [Hyphomicrobiales bacterium]
AILLDSGVRSGLDVLRACALGADFVLLGRPFFYGIAALGEQGAEHVVAILRDELLHAMRQHGVVRPTGRRGEQASPCQPSARPVSAASSSP